MRSPQERTHRSSSASAAAPLQPPQPHPAAAASRQGREGATVPGRRPPASNGKATVAVAAKAKPRPQHAPHQPAQQIPRKHNAHSRHA